MTHVRQKLREAAITAIIAAAPEFGGRVEKARGYLRDTSMLPSAEVTILSEQAQGTTTDGLLTRSMELGVTIYASGGAGVEDVCDALAVKIEKALLGTSIFALVQEMTPESMAFEISTEGETRIGRMQMTWAAVVVTQESDPETAI
jgi:hypothetical protein